MSIDWTRWLYRARVLCNPALWSRNDPTSPDFDRWLWGALGRSDAVVTLETDSPLQTEPVYVRVEGARVWIRNAPYADITAQVDLGGPHHFASRATALRAREIVQRMLQERYRWRSPEGEQIPETIPGAPS